jgi:hypothetical protein
MSRNKPASTFQGLHPMKKTSNSFECAVKIAEMSGLDFWEPVSATNHENRHQLGNHRKATASPS